MILEELKSHEVNQWKSFLYNTGDSGPVKNWVQKKNNDEEKKSFLSNAWSTQQYIQLFFLNQLAYN